jgi:hypothetical protein
MTRFLPDHSDLHSPCRNSIFLGPNCSQRQFTPHRAKCNTTSLQSVLQIERTHPSWPTRTPVMLSTLSSLIPSAIQDQIQKVGITRRESSAPSQSREEQVLEHSPTRSDADAMAADEQGFKRKERNRNTNEVRFKFINLLIYLFILFATIHFADIHRRQTSPVENQSPIESPGAIGSPKCPFRS